jgi:ABC-2 type transport system ATP-binding protein
MYQLPPETITRRCDELLEMMDLAGNDKKLTLEFSHGMKKKLALASALIPNPDLLFLDEPFEGVDAISARQIKDLLQSFVQRGGTVFLTSHVLEIVERLADHVSVIHEGRIVVQGRLADIASAAGGQDLERVFLSLVGAGSPARAGLDWLGA